MTEEEISTYLASAIRTKDPSLLCLQVLLIQLEEMRAIRTDLQNLQEQFDKVSGGGYAIKVYES